MEELLTAPGLLTKDHFFSGLGTDYFFAFSGIAAQGTDYLFDF